MIEFAKDSFRNTTPTVLFRAFDASSRAASVSSIINQKSLDGGGHRGSVCRVKQHPRFANDFWEGTSCTRSYGSSAGHRLGGRQSKALIERRKNEQSGRAIQPCKSLVRDVTS